MDFIPFDDRDGHIWMNGAFIPWRETKVHLLTHSLHYGSAVFEGERAYGGRIFRSMDHSTRLVNSAHILDYEIPFTAENFALSFSLPNFYFHTTTAYDILRMKGVPLGKRDFMGKMKVGA